jgi:hypothetical protein
MKILDRQSLQTADSPDPQQSIGSCQFRALHRSLQNAELMAEGEDLNLERRSAPE